MASVSNSDAVSLSDKCCICYGNPKYRCPRCSARTCSLTCSKTHKARALCSGVRNPADYLKRSEIATPKAFDQDFNFLSGLETKIGSARREVKGRGVDFEGAGGRNDERKREEGDVKSRDALERNFVERGVVVQRAPKGMSRREENETSWFKKRRLIRWMVEWQFLGRKLRTVVSENVSIADAHNGAIFHLLDRERSTGDVSRIKDYISAAGAQLPEELPGRKALSKELGPLSKNQNKRQFYLHLPERSNSQKQFVIPIDGQHKLCDVLRGQTIREFPTVVVTVPSLDDVDKQSYEIGPAVPIDSFSKSNGVVAESPILGKRKADEVDEESLKKQSPAKTPTPSGDKPETAADT